MNRISILFIAIFIIVTNANAQMFDEESFNGENLQNNIQETSNQQTVSENNTYSQEHLSSVTHIFTEIQPSETFLSNLRTCQKYREFKNIKDQNIETAYSMEILGFSSGKCWVRRTIKSKNGYSTSNCTYSQEDLSKYYEIISDYSMQNFKEMSDEEAQKIFDNYSEKLLPFMTNKAICSYNASYDSTKEFRKKIAKCTPFEFNMEKTSGNLLFQIIGMQNNTCKMNYIIYKQAGKISEAKPKNKTTKASTDGLYETEYHVSCSLSNYNLEELKLALEQETLKDADITQVIAQEIHTLGDVLTRFVQEDTCVLTEILQ